MLCVPAGYWFSPKFHAVVTLLGAKDGSTEQAEACEFVPLDLQHIEALDLDRPACR
jgi:hypothetical protein